MRRCRVASLWNCCGVVFPAKGQIYALAWSYETEIRSLRNPFCIRTSVYPWAEFEAGCAAAHRSGGDRVGGQQASISILLLLYGHFNKLQAAYKQLSVAACAISSSSLLRHLQPTSQLDLKKTPEKNARRDGEKRRFPHRRTGKHPNKCT